MDVSAQGHESESTDTAVVEGEVHEIRQISELRICPTCLVHNSAADQFCTACGASLAEAPTSEPVPDEETVVPAPSPPLPTGDLATPDRALLMSTDLPVVTARRAALGNLLRRKWPARTVVALIVAAVVVFAVLWQLETRHARSLSASLRSTRTELTTVRGELQRTQAKLGAETSLSNRRRAVLEQAKHVLVNVDPLLSSVDNLQSKAGGVSDEGSAISADAESFISTVADLVNYLVQTDPAYLDYSYINSAIDNANSELSSIRADESGFGGATAAYSSSSSSFQTKATAFTDAVRSLQRQLNEAVRP